MDMDDDMAMPDDMQEEEEEEEEEVEVLEEQESSPPTESTERVTTRYMTKYEKARILGTRALQIRYANPNPSHLAVA